VAIRTDVFDLSSLRLTTGEGRKLELSVAPGPFELAGEAYTVEPPLLDARLDVSKTTGSGYALRLRFEAQLAGPCMRCLSPAGSRFEIETREVSQPGAGDELESPYVEHGVLDLGSWAHDALALALPAQILCRPDCAGLCPVCGADLNDAGPEHQHERSPDPRWAKLSELKFDA
jgi:uncharacterized protein